MACLSQKKPGVEPDLEFIVHLPLLGLVDAVDVGHAQLLPLLRVALPLVPILLQLRQHRGDVLLRNLAAAPLPLRSAQPSSQTWMEKSKIC